MAIALSNFPIKGVLALLVKLSAIKTKRIVLCPIKKAAKKPLLNF
jgi:hypothetical protein